MPSNNRTILIAGMGTSPAVLTETVMALVWPRGARNCEMEGWRHAV
jgi:hypothetical protein